MTPKTQQPLHPYSVKIETPTGKSATLPVTLLTPKQAEQVQLEFKRLAHEAGIKGARINVQRVVADDLTRSSVRRRRACGLPCQRRHDRASLDEPETRTAPSNRGRFRFPKTLDESSDFNSGTSQIVAVAKIAV